MESQEKLRKMELGISLILRGGVLLSATVVLLGIAVFLVTGKTGYALDASQATHNTAAFIHYEGQTNANLYFPTNPADIVAGTLAFKAFGLIALGLFLLILTPILRVTVSVFTFALEGDWLYVGFTVFVLAILLVGFFLGKAGG